MRSTLAVLLAMGGLIAGCSSRNHTTDRRDMDDHGRYYGEPTTRDDRDAWNRLHSDPVCGMNVNPRSALKETYHGTTYYFDHKDCQRKFHDNPSAYLPNYDEDHRYPDDRRPRDVR